MNRNNRRLLGDSYLSISDELVEHLHGARPGRDGNQENLIHHRVFLSDWVVRPDRESGLLELLDLFPVMLPGTPFTVQMIVYAILDDANSLLFREDVDDGDAEEVSCANTVV